jgi:hypothetical protein
MGLGTGGSPDRDGAEGEEASRGGCTQRHQGAPFSPPTFLSPYNMSPGYESVSG